MLELKNKTEREAFVNNYKNWTDKKGKNLDVWKSVPALELLFYRYQFANGAALIVTEYQEYRMLYTNYTAIGRGNATKHKFCLMLPETDSYVDAGGTTHRTYTLDGCSMGTVVDYMTKNKLCI